MELPLYQVIEQYGIYAVFALCTIEGDITLLLSGVLAHSGFFGHYSFIKVLIFGTLGGMAGDIASYYAGRRFGESVKHYRFYQMAQPRIEGGQLLRSWLQAFTQSSYAMHLVSVRPSRQLAVGVVQ